MKKGEYKLKKQIFRNLCRFLVFILMFSCFFVFGKKVSANENQNAAPIITYYGLNKDNENIVSENIITPVVNTIVKTGIKSPYEAGVAFLSSPTKGGYVSSTFGEVRSNSVHKGIDIAKDLGEDVSAALEGEVIYAGYNNGGYGNLIILQHNNNMKTYYAHLSNIYVSVGEIVKKNDLIGEIGSTGNSTGPHLHFELRVDNNPVNPIKYIQQ